MDSMLTECGGLSTHSLGVINGQSWSIERFVDMPGNIKKARSGKKLQVQK